MRGNDLPPDFGARLRAARGYLDLTIGQMADKLGKNRNTIRAWEHGQIEHDPLKVAGIISRYSELSGLPEWWFITPDLTRLRRPGGGEDDRVKKAKKARRAVRRRRDTDLGDDEIPLQKAEDS